jgi:hypothetical protein
MNPSTANTDLSLIRAIAGAGRKLTKDMALSPLQAIDRLQKLHTQFQDHWITPPWLVLERESDGRSYTLPANMPVEKMLNDIKEHGQPIGIVGLAKLTAKRWTAFKMMFRADAKSRKTVEQSAAEAERRFVEYLKQFPSLHQGAAK